MIQRYVSKISGPLLDRIDIHIEAPAVKYADLAAKPPGEGSPEIRERVKAARKVQQERFKDQKIYSNAQMTPRLIRQHWNGDHQLAEEILDRLEARKLARRSKRDKVSIPVHPVVHSTVLILLAQILRAKGDALGMDLSPATDQPQLVDGLCEVLSVSSGVSPGAVVAFDLENVAPDLSLIPVDEVLDFRHQHLKEYKEYARGVRRFVREIGNLPSDERKKAFQDRQEEIRDLAADLKRTGWKVWQKPAAFSLSIAGAAWTLKTGDSIAGLLAATGALAGLGPDSPPQINAYSYLFASTRRSSY